MSATDLIVFDTSTLPEYYDDVLRVLALPPGHVVTYDYSAGNVTANAQAVLRSVPTGCRPRVVLAYVQPASYAKGEGTSKRGVIPAPTVHTLTRLARVVAVREVSNGAKIRFYMDLELDGYPYDPGLVIANKLITDLRATGEMPMKTYVAAFPSTAAGALFGQTETDLAFATVVGALSAAGSQFRHDTFWRITAIKRRTKSLLPLWLTKEMPLTPRTAIEGDRSITVLDVVDQSTLYFDIQFQRGEEHGSEYRMRRVTVEGSPKSTADLIRSSFTSRSFGRDVVAVTIPATSSLSRQELRVQFTTQLHEKDDVKDYPYGPQPAITIRYRKSVGRSILALTSIVTASALFGWAVFATTSSNSLPADDVIVPLFHRGLFVAVGVLLSLYAYYLWTDDVALDKARRP